MVPQLLRSASSVAELRAQLKTVFARDPSALYRSPMRAASPTTIAALEDYFDTVDPGEFNGASRVAFVWAFSAPEVAGARSTPTRQYLAAFFWADGDQMIAAGSIAPGFSTHLMRLSRPSAGEPWRVDGLWSP